MSVTITLHENRRGWSPGETLVGVASWNVAPPPKSAEVRLLWFTEPVTDGEVNIVERRKLENPPAIGQMNFSFKLPPQPHSFLGNLFIVGWAVEVVLLPGDGYARAAFDYGPGGLPIEAPH